VSNSIAFAQNNLYSKHLMRHSTSSSCSLKDLRICLSIQELAKSIDMTTVIYLDTPELPQT